MYRDTFISASAGTGKTYRLVSEYVNILKSDETLGIENVLAITFTEKAAKEMKERVSARLRQEATRKENIEDRERWRHLSDRVMHAWISTIHSFCDSLLRESLLYTDLKVDPGFSVVTGTRRLLEIQELRRFFESKLKNLDDLTGIVGLNEVYKTLEHCLSRERHNLYLYKPFALKDETDEDARIIFKATQACSKAFNELNRQYEEITLKNAQLDFDQMLELTRRLLKNNPAIAEQYARRFKHILVDEFQDTDELQAEIIDILKNAGNVRVFYVGDDKQSIYRFRGANVEIFNKTRKEFEEKGKATETLETSYRSHPDIVKFHNIFFSKIMSISENQEYSSRYDTVVQSFQNYGDTGKKRIRILKSKERDYFPAVARYINDLMSEEITFRERDGNTVTRKIQPGDISLLLRRFVNVKRYQNALEAEGIPYYTVGSRKFFERSEIAGLLALVSFLGNQEDDQAFLSFFVSPACGGSLEDAIRLKGESKHFCDALASTSNPEWKELRELVQRYSSLARVLKPGELIEAYVEESDYLPKMAVMDAHEQCIANVVKFLQISKELDSLGTSLREFSNNIVSYAEESQEGEAALENEKSNSVKIMTVHQAKGLEFPVVIVGEMTENPRKENPRLLFDSDSREFYFCDRTHEFGLLNSFLSTDYDKQIEEEKRTLYVALTRARELLIMNVSTNIIKKKPKKQSTTRQYCHNWIESLRTGLYKPGTQELEKEMEKLVEQVTPSQQKPAPTESAESIQWQEPTKEYMESFENLKYTRVHSPTSLQLEKETPEPLIIEDFELITGSPATAIGTYAHSVLENLGNPSGKPKGKMLKDLLSDLPDPLQSGIQNHEAENVGEILGKLVDHRVIRDIQNAEMCRSEELFERAFDKYILRGVVDKLYKTAEGWKIVDFKFAEKNNDFIDKYRFQMKFYLYLFKDLIKPASATVFFLKDGQTETVTLDDYEEFESEFMELIDVSCKRRLIQ